MQSNDRISWSDSGLMSDIHIKISQDGHASVRLSERFLSLSRDDQAEELRAVLYFAKEQAHCQHKGRPTATTIRQKMLESLLSAMRDGIRLNEVAWKVEGDIWGLSRDISQEYWLKLNI